MDGYNMASFFYEEWYREKIAASLSDEEKMVLARKISELTLEAPIWTDRTTDWSSKFPELKPFSSTGKISGLQLVAVMGAIMNEKGKSETFSGIKPLTKMAKKPSKKKTAKKG